MIQGGFQHIKAPETVRFSRGHFDLVLLVVVGETPVLANLKFLGKYLFPGQSSPEGIPKSSSFLACAWHIVNT